mgnify:FL=1
MAPRTFTKDVGNLKGFSTDSIFIRPSNVAEIALNVMKSPDGSLTPRRGFQCEIAATGGLGLGTYDNPELDEIEMVTIGLDGLLYKRLHKKIYLYYTDSSGLGRYLTFSIFTDPRFLTSMPWGSPWTFMPWGSPAGESITSWVTLNRAAQVNGTQNNVNTVIVDAGHVIQLGDSITFPDVNGQLQQRTVTSTAATTITFAGQTASFLDNTYIGEFLDIPFRKGYDVGSAYDISTYLTTLPSLTGLTVAANGATNYPAAFLNLVEPIQISTGMVIELDYYYWEQVNKTVTTTFEGISSSTAQNSPEFENASMATYDDVIYIADGVDYPQKYDGQTVYRAGMPDGDRPGAADNTSPTPAYEPFAVGETFDYLVTYEQVDNLGHIVEGPPSLKRQHTVAAATAAINITLDNILVNTGWNTDGAQKSGVIGTPYGPDSEGYYYTPVPVTAGHTFQIGDTAFYLDEEAAKVDGAQSNVNTIDVDIGHAAQDGDRAYFYNYVDPPDPITYRYARQITKTSSDSITVDGNPVTVADDVSILIAQENTVIGNVAIVDGTQSSVNAITVQAGHTVQANDFINFEDSSGRIQGRTVSSVGATTVTVAGIPVSVDDDTVMITDTIRTDTINLRRQAANAMVITNGKVLSNNLRINIYRTRVGPNDLSEFFLLATLPNDAITGTATQVFLDNLEDLELGRGYQYPVALPQSPPICKYLTVFGNQMVYAGGENNNSDDSDIVYFSEGFNPEAVALATNSINVPSVDDDVTGVGVAGSTLIIFKNKSIDAVTGDLLVGPYQVSPVAPGSNIGCVAHATIARVGSLLYFCSPQSGVYTITESQLFPTDPFGNPIPVSVTIDKIFRENRFLPYTKFVFKRAVAVNYAKDNQYLLFLPCEDSQATIRVANANSRILAYDYEGKNWFEWNNMNAAGGMVVVNENLYFQERRYSGFVGNTANLYRQHRFYRLIDYADHTSTLRTEWRSSWEDMGLPAVRKIFRCFMLYLDRYSDLQQLNNPVLNFSSYVDRIENLQSTISTVTTVDNVRNSVWGMMPWGWGRWSGYQDSFIRINPRMGTVAKSIQIGFTTNAINMGYKLAGFQLEAVPEFRRTVTR